MCSLRLLLASLLLIIPIASAVHAAETASVGAWEEPDVPVTRALPPRDLQDALAHVVIERNRVSSQRDSLQQQRWLILIYAVVVSLLAGWAAHALLRRRSVDDPGALPETTTRRKPANATITIRNGATQEIELSGRVTTRTRFRRSAAEATTKLLHAATPQPEASEPAPAAHPVPTSKPMTARWKRPELPSEPANRPPTESVFRQPITPPRRRESTDYAPTDQTPTGVPVASPGTQESILLPIDLDDDLRESTSERHARKAGHDLARQGLSLLEVMISLAILATILASVSGGIFSLGSAQRTADEQAVVSDAMRMWSERIIGADWDWLGRDRIDDPLRGAWSWQRPETTSPLAPGDHPPLSSDATELIHQANRQVLGSDAQLPLQDLRLFLEYYHPIALEMCFMTADAEAARTTWSDSRESYRLTPPIDLRLHTAAVVVRLSATWKAHTGGAQQRELIFARTR